MEMMRYVYRVGDAFLMLESDWWIEVEYIDAVDRMSKRFTAQNMSRNGKFLVEKIRHLYKWKSGVY